MSAFASFDDGTGPALYAGGAFLSAGEVSAQHIARWNGTTWSSVGSGFNGTVRTLAVLDDGNGPALYAGGAFTMAGATTVNGIAKWDGTNWLPLGTGVSGGAPNSVQALCAFDDGSGVGIFAGGRFTHAGGIPVGNIARWKNGSWSSIGGVSNTGSYTTVDVEALAVYDDGSGTALFVGGYFNIAGGINAGGIARWNGAHWSSIDGFLTCHALAVWDSGSGPELYVGTDVGQGGSFQFEGIARWNGGWSPVGFGFGSPGGSHGRVYSLIVHDDGSGEQLYAGGEFASADLEPARDLARFDGKHWTSLASTISSMALTPDVSALATYDEGSGPVLFVGGDFQWIDNTAALRVVRRDANGFSRVGSGNGISSPTIAGPVRCTTVMSSGGEERLIVGGGFQVAGTTIAKNIASFDGQTWTALGSGTSDWVLALAKFDEGHGAGPVLFAAGDFTQAGGGPTSHIARWDGSTWSPVNGGTNNEIDSLIVFDDGSGPALYAAGIFSSAGGGAASGCIARWDGNTWSSVGVPPVSEIHALTVFDDGSGPALFGYTNVYTPPVYDGGVYKWNGTTWSQVGASFNLFLASLHVHTSGGQSKLYAGINGQSANALWRLDGSSWTPIPGLQNGTYPAIVRTMETFDEGLGNAPSLIVGGSFSSGGSAPAINLARWDGAQWSAMDGNFTTPVPTAGLYALALFHDPAAGGHTLIVGGGFRTGLGAPSSGIAERTRCYGPTNAYCFGDGSLTTSCPCSNFGAQGHGCASSAVAAGAQLSTSGTPSLAADTLVLQQIDSLAHAFTIVLQGNATIAGGTAFGDGLRCAGGSLKRLYTKSAVNGTVTAPEPGDPSISARSSALGDPLGVGSVRYHQAYYRDPVLAFCPDPSGKAFNVGNAVRVVWGP